MQSKKPIVEDFIKGAKASQAEKIITEPAPETAPPSLMAIRGEVTFPLHVPRDMHTKWKKFAHKAERSLHDFICTAVQEKIANMEDANH